MRTRIQHSSEAPTVRRVGSGEAARLRAEAPARTAWTGAGEQGGEAPVVLGRYRLRRRLGTGAFATVWLAHDERLDRQVAVKILPRERVVGGRFEREARAAARLAHPGIVTLYEAAVDEEGAYLVSELVRGATLEQLLAAGQLSDRDVVQIGIALCDALAHAHAHGVIHRDVKPSNVLVPDRHATPAQLARLTDFGVARVVGGDSLTRTGDVIGTAAYMAPEQAQGLPAGAAADVFSLALVLYEALSGVNPVRTHGGARRAGAHLPALRRQRRDLPRELGQAVDLALRPRPAERGTIEELRSALVTSIDRVGDQPGVVAEPWPARTVQMDDEDAGYEEMPTAPAGEAVPWPRRAMAAVAAAGVSVWVVRRTPGTLPVPPALAACAAGMVVAALPRVGWLAITALMAGSLAVNGHPAEALVLIAAALVPVALSPRDGAAWPLAAGAPALASLSLAATWPALAGLAGRSPRRAALGATGAAWTVLWAQDISAPVLSTGTLVACGVWALAALTLPWTRSRRWPALEAVRLALWAIGLGAATALAERVGGNGPVADPGMALLGALVGALVAFVTRRLTTRLSGHQIGGRSRSDRVPSR